MNSLYSLAETQLHDSHYLKSITNWGDYSLIVATRDIHSTSGLKLVSRGMQINSNIYNRLLDHKLIPSLDHCLAVDDSVSGEVLSEYSSRLIEKDLHLSCIKSANMWGWTLPEYLAHIPTNSTISFKLTAMKETQPELFQHSVYVALVSTYIGMQMQMEQEELTRLCTAGLLHDIGILHVDPKLLSEQYRMNDAERRHLYVHPITSWMILKSFPEYHSNVLNGVLHHHERLDGSGYPQGLSSDQIGIFGQIIAVAEIIASRYKNENDAKEWARLGTIVKLNMRRYGSDIVRHLKIFFQDGNTQFECSDIDKAAALEKLTAISTIFTMWKNNSAQFEEADPLSQFIDERMANLQLEITDAGLDPYIDSSKQLEITENSHACFEGKILVEETIWQLKTMHQEIKRRWPTLQFEGSKEANWVNESRLLLSQS